MPALFLLLGAAMIVAGAFIWAGTGAALFVAGVLMVAVGADLARRPRDLSPDELERQVRALAERERVTP